MSNEIPKIIHYCWFGKGKKSGLTIKCIESWKENCKDFSIKEWNEDNFNVDSNIYTKEAYSSKKYAFVADYVRLYALYNEGGVYLDTDVEIIKPIEQFLKHQAFSGFQSINEIPTGLIGAMPGNTWIFKNLEVYNNKHFVKEDGSLDTSTNVTYITKISKGMGFEEGNSFQILNDGTAIYPVDYFCAKDYKSGKIKITNNTYSIHHFSGSWLSRGEKVKMKLRKMIGNQNYELIKKILKKYNKFSVL